MPRATIRQVLRACYDYWQAEFCEPAERTVCYAWVESRCRHLFGATFHPSLLERLVEQGHLEKAGCSRGGRRRYYRLTNPDRTAAGLIVAEPACATTRA
jgi:hypothetical protein